MLSFRTPSYRNPEDGCAIINTLQMVAVEPGHTVQTVIFMIRKKFGFSSTIKVLVAGTSEPDRRNNESEEVIYPGDWVTGEKIH